MKFNKDQTLSLKWYYNMFFIEEGKQSGFYQVFEDEEEFNLGD